MKAFKDGRWGLVLSPNYDLWILEWTKHGNCDKNIDNIYLDRDPALRTVQKWFGRFHQGHCNLKDQPRSGWPCEVNEDALLTIGENKRMIPTEEMTKYFKNHMTNTFRHLKSIRLKKNGRILQIEMVLVFVTTTQDCMLQDWPYRSFKSWNVKTHPQTPYSPDLAYMSFHLIRSLQKNLNEKHLALHSQSKRNLQPSSNKTCEVSTEITSASLWTTGNSC